MSERNHALDACRAAAMLLGIAFHASFAYREHAVGAWPLDDAFRQRAFEIFGFWSHAFRMELFYLLSGYFAALGLERRGIAGFLRQRALRILLPFAVASALLLPLMTRLLVFGKVYAWNADPAGAWRLSRQFAGFGQGNAHLWFLEYLALFSALTAGIAALATRAPLRARNVAAVLDRAFLRVSALPYAGAALALPVALLLLPIDHAGRMRSPTAWRPDPGYLAYYGVFFAWGFLWFRNRKAAAFAASRSGLRALLAALALLVSWQLLVAKHRYPALEPAFLYSHALLSWLTIEAALALFQRHFGAARAWIRYFVDASYWMYLAHLPLVLALQIACWHGLIPGALRFWAVLAASCALLLVTYQLGVRHTPIGRVLNGSRRVAG